MFNNFSYNIIKKLDKLIIYINKVTELLESKYNIIKNK